MFGGVEGGEGGFEGFECGLDGGAGDGERGSGRTGFKDDFFAREEGDLEGEARGGGKCAGKISAQFFESEAKAWVAEEYAVVGLVAGPDFLLSFSDASAGGFDGGADADTFGQRLHGRHDEFGGFEDGYVTVRLGVHAFAVEAKIVCEGVDEGSLISGHWLEAQTPLGFVGGEDAEFPFLRLCPFDVF